MGAVSRCSAVPANTVGCGSVFGTKIITVQQKLDAANANVVGGIGGDIEATTNAGAVGWRRDSDSWGSCIGHSYTKTHRVVSDVGIASPVNTTHVVAVTATVG